MVQRYGSDQPPTSDTDDDLRNWNPVGASDTGDPTQATDVDTPTRSVKGWMAMKVSIALTLVGLVAMSTSASAQVRVGGNQPRTGADQPAAVSYGAVTRPQQPKLSATRKPAQVANVPVRPAETQAPKQQQQAAKHSPTTRAPLRTAQMPMGEMVGAPMHSGSQGPGCATCNQGGSSGGYVDGGSCGAGGCGAGGCGSGVFPYGPLNRMPLVRGWYVPFWHSTGDMPQHIAYFPNAHGYYYFHPYNVIHINQQQEMVTRWGLDARNPMDNRFLERIYQEQEAAQLQDGGNQVIPQPVLPR
jgi:hypothetical protein